MSYNTFIDIFCVILFLFPSLFHIWCFEPNEFWKVWRVRSPGLVVLLWSCQIKIEQVLSSTDLFDWRIQLLEAYFICVHTIRFLESEKSVNGPLMIFFIKKFGFNLTPCEKSVFFAVKCYISNGTRTHNLWNRGSGPIGMRPSKCATEIASWRKQRIYYMIC